jgi:hypothetical protein
MAASMASWLDIAKAGGKGTYAVDLSGHGKADSMV